MVVTNCKTLAEKLKHLTTTAKVAHTYEFVHDAPGFNYRLPNLNAALGCAQLNRIEEFLMKKRNLAHKYMNYFENSPYLCFTEPDFAYSNYWLNAIFCENIEARNNLLKISNAAGVMTRPAWKLMIDLPMFTDCERGDLAISRAAELRLVCLPSSVSK